jgi:hypothetical protein
MNMEIPDIRPELADEFETASKSTGPHTATDKQRSAQNARKHGFYGEKFYWEAMVALGEGPCDYQNLVKEYKLYLDEYVQTTRAARVASMLPTEGQWPAIGRQQNALERLLERKIRLLMELQEHRIVYAAPPPASVPRPTPPPGADPARDPALSRGERVARNGAFTSRRGSGEGLLHCCTHPAQNTENSRNELHDLLQSQGLSPYDPSKRTGPFAQNEPQSDANQTKELALSPGERVGRDGAFTSRCGSGDSSLHYCPHPAQHTENGAKELHDLLQTQVLTRNGPSKRTGPTAQNELVDGHNELLAGDGSLRSRPCRRSASFAPIHEPTPHPSCSGWRKRRSPPPSPHGRGLLCHMGERAAHDGAFSSGRGSGEESLHCCPRPAQHVNIGTNSTICYKHVA